MIFLIMSSPAYMPRTKVCISSIKKFHPEAKIHLEMIDSPVQPGSYIPEMYKQKFEIAIKLLEENPGEELVLLGADCVLYYKIDEDVKRYLEFDRLVITPHVIYPPKTNNHLYQTGHCNSDVMFARHDAIPIFKWLLTQEIKNDIQNGFFYEQTLLSSVPFLFNNIKILRDPSYNAAYYNLHERKLCFTDDEYTVRVKDLGRILSYNLKIFHFTGFEEGKPEKISKHYKGPNATGDVLKLFKEYDEAVRNNK